MMHTILQDARYAIRTMLKSPGFTVVAVLTLALGIGANTAIFTVFHAALLKRLPYDQPSQLVHLYETRARQQFAQMEASYPDFVDWKQQVTSFTDLAGYGGAGFTILGGDQPERISASRVTSNFFRVLGVQPHLGRDFRPEEDQPNSRVVLLTYGYWQRRFASKPEIVGQSLNMDGIPYTIIGVLPESFQFAPRGSSDAWVPLNMTQDQQTRRSLHWLNVIGRLKPGVTLEQANTEMTAIAARLASAYPDFNSGVGAIVRSLQQVISGPVRDIVLVLMAAVGCVLLIACVNVANLMLARAATREREMAIRAALGAGRLRLLRQVLVESVMMALVAAALGIAWASWGVDLLLAAIPAPLLNAMPYLKGIGLNAPVLIFTIGISIFTGIAFGLIPALQASRLGLHDSLKEGARGSAGPGRSAIRKVLVVTEVALALVLLIAAGLITQSMQRLMQVKLGFSPENLLTFRVLLPAAKYTQPEQAIAFFQQLRQRASALPGVESVSMISSLPVSTDGNTVILEVEGRPASPGQEPEAAIRTVSPNYFEAMGIPVLQGRAFNERDTAAAPRVMIVNKTLAERVMAGDAVGRKLILTFNRSVREVVGVVGDVRLGSFDVEVRPTVYVVDLQSPMSNPAIVVRAAGDPGALLAAMRAEVHRLDKDLPLFLVNTMDQIIAQAPSVFNRRFSGLLLGSLSGVALLLACVGLYGVVNYSVAQRTREIGVRMALGAQTGDVVRLFLAQGMKLVWIGVACGLMGAFAATRLMQSLLYGTSATDPLTFGGVALLLSAVALLATYVPAHRATKIDPIIALRYE